MRGSIDYPVYDKNHRNEVVYIINEDGESICAVQKPRRVIAPLSWLGSPTKMNDRILALLEAAADGEFGPGNPNLEVDADGLESHFRAVFPTGKLRIFSAGQTVGLYDELELEPNPGSLVICVQNEAGIIVTRRENGHMGILVFGSRVAGCRIKTS